MAINFHPRRGTVLMCDFEKGGFQPPEMVKIRPVVVISGKHNDKLCTVVPLSGTEPERLDACHHLMEDASMPYGFAGPMWAKCDMVTTVAFWRLDRVRAGRDGNGKRIYEAKSVTTKDLQSIEKCLIQVLRMSHLTTATKQPIITPSPEMGL